MQFELSKALIDDILFHMEDQNGEFRLDTRRGYVTGINEEFDNDNDENGDRFVPLPKWDSIDGYHLMERFAAGLHSPLAREELSAALDRGRGVFRAFKDVLAQYPETEKLWFDFKDREMRRKIIAWYNGLREYWGMELIGEEPEDISGLVLEDFRFRESVAADSAAAVELHRSCLALCGDDIDQKTASETLAEMSQWVFPGDFSFVAENAGGEFAACVSGVFAAPGHLHICVLEVKPQFRGLGLGEALLERLLEKADAQNIRRVSIDLPAYADYFSRALARESFKPCVRRFCRGA
jgi:ribosomal protein S18 acetylase RimI-like enzyme